MQEEILKLLKLLAEDDDFALSFDSAESVQEKYDLAKSKCKSLQKDDFVKFLLEFQAEQLEVNEKELSKVSGGVDKRSLVTKLTALAMLGMTFGSMSSVGMASAGAKKRKAPKANANVFSTQVTPGGGGLNTNAPTGKNPTLVENEIVRLRTEWWGGHGDNDKIEVTAGGKTYTMNKEQILHTVVGKFDLIGVKGSHSKEVNDEIFPKMELNNVKWYCDNVSNVNSYPPPPSKHTYFNDGVLTKDNYWTNLENIINEVMSSPSKTDDHQGDRHCYKAFSSTAGCNVNVVVDDSDNVITSYPY